MGENHTVTYVLHTWPSDDMALSGERYDSSADTLFWDLWPWDSEKVNLGYLWHPI